MIIRITVSYTHLDVYKRQSLGVESLTNGELIAILINSGTKERSAVDLAEEVLAKDQAGIGYLRESSLEELMTVKGIGSSKAARIVAAVELGKRIALKPVQKGMKIQDDEDVAEPVSYTHLDVYKRQSSLCTRAGSQGNSNLIR